MEGTSGKRIHFSVIATSTPKLLVDAGSRQAVLVYNNSGVDIRIGHSGSLSSIGLLMGTAGYFQDVFSSDDWWVIATSSSGTVSGYIVI